MTTATCYTAHPLEMVRCEPCDGWYRIWMARNGGTTCNDVSFALGRRLMERLAERYNLDRAGLYTGRAYLIRTGWQNCAGRSNQIDCMPCAICGNMTHDR